MRRRPTGLSSQASCRWREPAGAGASALRSTADLSAWSAVHGLSMLLIDGPLRELPHSEREIALEQLLQTIERGLSRPADI